MTRPLAVLAVLAASLVPAAPAEAQPLGTFRWQLQPYCNGVTVNLTQNGAVYTADGYDDQCGGPQRAPLVGLATQNPDGTIGFGLHVVLVPGGGGLHIDARISLPSGSGTWSDSAGNSGTFAFGAATGGSPRPAPSAPGGGGGATIPPTFSLLTDGGFLARGTWGVGNIPASGNGTRMMWHPKKAAFRAGEVNSPGLWEDGNIGSHSTAFGLNSAAIGPYSVAGGANAAAIGISSTAFGSNAQANGNYSTAFGADTRANGAFGTASGRSSLAAGDYSTAFGYGTQANGQNSLAAGFFNVAGDSGTAFGYQSTAGGFASLAVGFQSVANGMESVAIGRSVRTGGDGSVVLGSRVSASAAADGSFTFADRSTNADLLITQPNEFNVRVVGGAVFSTNAAASAGVVLAGNGGNSWASFSDVNMKENFRDVPGEELLSKIAGMSIQEWNYKSQDASFRHMGPTAQEFRAAFGLGDFPLRINTIDADGVALAGVKALEARTRETNERLTRENDELRARLARLEALLEKH